MRKIFASTNVTRQLCRINFTWWSAQSTGAFEEIDKESGPMFSTFTEWSDGDYEMGEDGRRKPQTVVENSKDLVEERLISNSFVLISKAKNFRKLLVIIKMCFYCPHQDEIRNTNRVKKFYKYIILKIYKILYILYILYNIFWCH